MFKQAIELVNFFAPIVIIALTLLGLARSIGRFEFDRKIKEIEAKSLKQDATLEAIRKEMDQEKWQRAVNSINKDSQR